MSDPLDRIRKCLALAAGDGPEARTAAHLAAGLLREHAVELLLPDDPRLRPQPVARAPAVVPVTGLGVDLRDALSKFADLVEDPDIRAGAVTVLKAWLEGKAAKGAPRARRHEDHARHAARPARGGTWQPVTPQYGIADATMICAQCQVPIARGAIMRYAPERPHLFTHDAPGCVRFWATGPRTDP